MSTLTRSYTPHEAQWDRFLTPPYTSSQSSYNHQYNSIYELRLQSLSDRIVQSSDATNPHNPIPSIIEIPLNEPFFVIGTLVKDCLTRTDAESTGDGLISHKPLRSEKTFGSKEDTIVLEDASGRIELGFDAESGITIGELCTGIVCGIEGVLETSDKVGKANNSGAVVNVTRVIFPSLPPPPVVSTNSDIGGSVMILSGLEMSNPSNTHSTLSLEMLFDYVTGVAGLDGGHAISRILIAGGLLPARNSTVSNGSSSSSSRSIGRNTQREYEPMAELSQFLHRLTSSNIGVDIIPGVDDYVTNRNLPQQPIHPCLFGPNSSATTTNTTTTTGLLNRASNPYQATIGGKLFLGSDGSPVRDMCRYCSETDDTAAGDAGDANGDVTTNNMSRALTKCLQYGHLAPTSPDSLGSHPIATNSSNSSNSNSTDPMVMECRPHVLFAGNCDDFRVVVNTSPSSSSDDSGMNATSTHCVCVPHFASTGKAVLVTWGGAADMEVKCLTFDPVCRDDISMEE